MDDLESLEEAVVNWRNSTIINQIARERFLKELKNILEKEYTLAEVSEIIGMNRTTLHYMLYGQGKGGKRAVVD